VPRKRTFVTMPSSASDAAIQPDDTLSSRSSERMQEQKMRQKDARDASGHNAPKLFEAQPAMRMRAADYVFETLSHAILTGELTPGSVLATQRELSHQFGVSPLVVRQATHRLEELGLVRVRQGSTTIVLDPSEASDVRLMQLQLELATPGDRLALAAREMQVLASLSLLALAERRIGEEQCDELEKLVESLPDTPNGKEWLLFRLQFWGVVARATQNGILEHQVRWWARVMQDLEKRSSPTVEASTARTAAGRTQFRTLVKALRKRRGAVEYWLKVIDPLFDWAEAQPNHPVQQQRAKAAPESSKRSRLAQ
jgi:GntR family transcriptional repressor for pyruvate dehydrogenase complex